MSIKYLVEIIMKPIDSNSDIDNIVLEHKLASEKELTEEYKEQWKELLIEEAIEGMKSRGMGNFEAENAFISKII
ncbi:hypothetical protein [Fusobacterium gastrosuis]|uniref:hypothetical protein n=1 Tax=Fusobacterium gastrosuis TaxID=1755100 RepID=UPI002A9CBA5D|nr:hypothetical protein [Fusobacterium gastrosuis]